MVPTGFRGKHRDAVRSDIPQSSSAREDQDPGSPCPHDDDFFDARPDAAETEEAISKFMSGLESQEQSGFDRLQTLLTKLPDSACPSCNNRQQNVACCSIGRRLSSQNGRGAAEKVHAFRAVIVQARCGIHVYTMYIHVCTMFV